MSLIAPTPEFLKRLGAVVGPNGLRADDEMARYLEDPRDITHGQAAAVLRPGAVEEVAQALALCAAARVGVVPWGGGTGLVGGQIAADGPPPVLLSLERMNRIRDVSLEDDVLIAEAGCALESVHAAAEAADRLFPLSYASKGSATIGGAMAVNSGGVAVLRYGNARDLCLGVEAAFPDGSIHRGLKRLRKDNTGYDLRHLLIGSEGTLGVVTAATLKLFARPREQATALAAVPDPHIAVQLLRRLQAACGDAVTAFELIAGLGLDFVAEHVPGPNNPFGAVPEWSVLIEVSGAGARDALEQGLGAAFEADLLTDAILAESEGQRLNLWALREGIPEGNRKVGAIASHDISVPVGRIAAFIAAAADAVAAVDARVRVNCFGHLGDGNLHYNLFPEPGGSRRHPERAALSEAVYETVDRFEGSISAEHGIGRYKIDLLERYGDPAKLAATRAIKAALDPAGVMNPGAILRRATD